MYTTVVEVRNALYPGDWSDGNQPDSNSLTNTAVDLSNEQLIDAINEADSLIDSYIGGRYQTPVLLDASGMPYASTPHPIDFWSRNIAAYNATLTYASRQDFTDEDPVARRYNMTMTALTAVRDGKATLGIPDNLTPNADAGAGQAINQYYGHLFEPRDFDLYPVRSGWPLWPGGRSDSW